MTQTDELEITIPKAMFKALDEDDFVPRFDIDEVEPDPYDGSLDGDDSAALEHRGLVPPPPGGFEKSEAGIWVPSEKQLEALPAEAKQRVVPFPREVEMGDEDGIDVTAIQRALKAAGHPRATKDPNRHFGGHTRNALMNFQKRKGLKVDGVYGKNSHAKLMPFYDKYGIFLMSKAKDQEEKEKKNDVPRGIEATGIFQYNNRWVVHYTQGWRRMSGVRGNLRPPKIGGWEDCSSSYTWWCFAGGSPDPNGGTAYSGRGSSARGRSNPQGYTGTLINHGRRVSGHTRGAAIIYGSSWSYTKHVAAGIGTSGKVVSFGSYPTRILWWNYRSDDLCWRVYW